MLFHLDYNAYSRAADMEEALRAATGKKVMIDHHQQPEEWPDFMYSDTTMSSTCQMIYEFCEMYDWTGLLDKGSAECLYTGIVTDTGSFKYSATSSRTHEVAGRLLELGVESQEVQNSIFDAQPVARLRLLGAMLDQLERNSSGSIILLYLSQAQCELLGYEKGITEGFVNYGLSIEGAQMTLFMREEDGIVKLSLRSKGIIDVNEIARASFNGGGHKNAAGGKLEMALPEALAYAKKVFSWD
jgi:phosphoesterase RecJ-like protein